MKTFFTIIAVLVGIGLLFIIGCRQILQSRALVGGYFEKDGTIYYDTGLINLGTRHSWAVEGLTLASFQQVNKLIAHDQKQVYYAGKVVVGAQGSSFEHLKEYWWKDENTVYHRAAKVSDDPQHFEFIYWRNSYDPYSKDLKRVYFQTKVIQGADPTTFRHLEYNYFADAHRAYYGQVPIPKSFGPHFQVLSEKIAMDEQYVWLNGTLIDQADPQTFRTLEGAYSRDKNYIFYHKAILSDRPEHFQVLGKGRLFYYSTDGYAIFYGGNPLDNADVATFEVLGEGYARDAFKVYLETKVLPELSPASFQVLNKYYTKDSNQVFFRGKAIDGADASTFVCNPKVHNLGADKYGPIRGGKRGEALGR